MTAAQALEELKALCAWDKTPSIEEGRLQAILTNSRVVDGNGYAPSDDEWGSPTGDPATTPDGAYDMNLAAQRAWQEKAGNAAHCTDFTSDGESKDRSQILKHCLTMADEYKRRRASSLASTDAQGRSLALLPWQIGNGPCCCD